MSEVMKNIEHQTARVVVLDMGADNSQEDLNNVSDFAETAMQWAVAEGIITGKDDGVLLNPQGVASRAECAAIIMRYMEWL